MVLSSLRRLLSPLGRPEPSTFLKYSFTRRRPEYRPVFATLPPKGLRVKSEYSTIIVKDAGRRRCLYFHRASGKIVLESAVLRRAPYALLIPSTQVPMAALLLQPEATKVLLVGVGGGGMVHYFQAEHPGIALDAVDIDIEIISVAQSCFGIEPSPKLRLHAVDGLSFIEGSDERYEVIFMDSFLKPSAATDASGTHLRLRTLDFYRRLADRLTPQGVAAFNIANVSYVQQDVALLRQVFPQIWVLTVPRRANTMVLASRSEDRVTADELKRRARILDRQVFSLSFRELAAAMSRASAG